MRQRNGSDQQFLLARTDTTTLDVESRTALAQVDDPVSCARPDPEDMVRVVDEPDGRPPAVAVAQRKGRDDVMRVSVEDHGLHVARRSVEPLGPGHQRVRMAVESEHRTTLQGLADLVGQRLVTLGDQC